MTTALGAYATPTALKAFAKLDLDTDDDVIAGAICDRINQYIESCTRQVIAPLGSATYTYDGKGLSRLFLPLPTGFNIKGIGGFRAITKLEIAPQTGGDYEEIAAGDYFLRERFGVMGPYRWLILSDHPDGSYRKFPAGRATVQVTGTAGWSSIPDDLTEVALVVAQRAWNAREVGYQDVAGTDEMGKPVVARFLSGRDRETLRRYTIREVI